jgi:hypothetical protein
MVGSSTYVSCVAPVWCCHCITFVPVYFHLNISKKLMTKIILHFNKCFNYFEYLFENFTRGKIIINF